MYRKLVLALLIAIGVSFVTANAADAAGLGLGARISHVMNRDTDESTNMGGVMARLRSQFFGLEGAVDYRSEDLGNGTDMKMKSWPVTASLMIYPIPAVYALAGAGWYNTTLSSENFDDTTETEFGYHLGAGVEVPVATKVHLTGDLRYTYLDYDFDELPDTIGKVKADSFSLHGGVLFYLR